MDPPTPTPPLSAPAPVPAASDTVRASGVAPTIIAPGAAAQTVTGSAAPTHLQAEGSQVSTSPEFPPASGTSFGRYRLERCLGVGGMGVVYKAWDNHLQRAVALKQIRGGDAPAEAETLERFEREARLAAKLRHPNVVSVHDVGCIDGKRFLTMDFVEGRTFGALLDETRAALRNGERPAAVRQRQAVSLLADIAAAVAYAHSQGVIHRDLKPANVLIDGSGRPFVMDFGLAKEVAGASRPEPGDRPGHGLTVTGQALGTPLYMSPEQATGVSDAVGPATDVWSLGAMLYEIMTGRTAFEDAGSPWAVLAAVLNEEVPRPTAHNRYVPGELEAVCLKALEKDLGRRYGSAGEFEQELRRWLRGEPVVARRPGLAYRLWRRAVRHRVAAAVACTVLAVACIAGYFRWSAEQERSAAIAAREEALGQLREHARLCVDQALAWRRKGFLTEARALAPTLEDAVRRARERLHEPSAEPEFHVGRMRRAMLDPEGALQAQDAALALDPRFAPSLYERAVLCAGKYARRLEAARALAAMELGQRLAQAGKLAQAGGADARLDAPTASDLEGCDPELRRWKDECVASIGRLRTEVAQAPTWKTHPAAALRVGEGQLACVEGLLAGFDSETKGDEALRLLEEAVAADPDREEEYEGIFRVRMERKQWEEAEKVCTRVLERDRGYVPHLGNRAAAHYWRGIEEANGGRDPLPAYEGSIADCDAALALDPSRAELVLLRALVHQAAMLYRQELGQDVSRDVDAALADFARSLELDPGSAKVWTYRGALRGSMAILEFQRGQDREKEFAAALTDFDRAIEIEPRFPDPFSRRGSLLATWAYLQFACGRDFAPLFTAAVADLTRTLELDPRGVEGWLGRSHAHGNWGWALQGRGEDPTEQFTAAIADLDRALELRPDEESALERRGLTQMGLGEYQGLHGGDPAPRFAAARADLDRCVRSFPNDPGAWFRLGELLLHQARWRMGPGQDAVELLENAMKAFAKSAEINPKSASAWLAHGQARSTLATVKAAQGADPLEEYTAAIADLTRAGEFSPKYATIWQVRGEIRLQWALVLVSRGEDAAELLTAAVADYGLALEINPKDATSQYQRGMSRRIWAGQIFQQGKDPTPLAEEAMHDLDLAVESAMVVPARNERAKARCLVGEWRKRWNLDAAPDYRKAAEDLEASLRQQANQPEIRSLLEQVRAALSSPH